MNKPLRLLACQIAVPATPRGGARDEHLARTAELIKARLREEPADLVVLPELSSLDYSKNSFERLEALAEPLDGPSFEAFSPLACKFSTTIAYGIARRAENGVHISQVIVGPSGAILGHYDKLHLAPEEKAFFVPGNHIFFFEIAGVKAAPIICYDIRFPELTRRLTVDCGVSLILHSAAYRRDPTFHSWHPFAITRANENQLFILSLNRGGEEWGHSILCPPWMDERHPHRDLAGSEERLALLELDMGEVARIRRNYTLLGDARGDYAKLPVIGARRFGDERASANSR